MAKVRDFIFNNMWAKMHRLQDEEDPADESEDPGDDEIYGIVTVVERDPKGRVLETYTGGSKNFITITKADREKWRQLEQIGEWFKIQVPVTSHLEVTWFLMEEDSLFGSDLQEALDELVKELGEELAELPGAERAKRLYGATSKFVAKANSDDVLGSYRKHFDVGRMRPKKGSHIKHFPCRVSAYYTAVADVDYSAPYED